MPDLNFINIFTGRLHKAAVEYMITGSVASIIYGEPRLTHDVDIVIDIKKGSEEKILAVFPIDEFYCPPVEIIKLESKRDFHGHFNIIHNDSGLKADIYTKGNDELHNWAMSEKRRIQIEGDSIWVAPPEYVIIRKLEYYREGGSDKHVRDIRSMIEISGSIIRFGLIEELTEKRGLQKEWKILSNEDAKENTHGT